MSVRGLAGLSCAFFAFGCAREARVAETPRAGLPWATPTDYAWPPRVNAPSSQRPSVAERTRKHPVTTSNRAPLPSDRALPGGERCLELLRASAVPFRELESSRGVDTPIVVNGPIHGIEFWSPGGPMLVDCRFALGLSRVAPHFAALGIVRVRFSGAYVYRTSRSGRLSLHAYGLALDVHEVSTRAATYSVKRDFARGLGDGCVESAPLLNRLYCRLLAPGLFRELLTPDYNADHYDHLHLGIAPLGEPSKRLGALTSLEAKPKRQAVARAENPRRRSLP